MADERFPDPHFEPSAKINVDVPHSARIWNYWMGGKDNYEVDRTAGDAYIAAAVPSGSYLALYDSIVTSAAHTEATVKYAETGAVPYLLRSLEQIGQCFEGLEMVDPGLVPITQWRPDAVEIGQIEPIDSYGAVARKP